MSSQHGSAAGGRLLRDANEGVGRQELNRPEEFVGDKCGKKNSECLRIMTQNINGFGQKADNLKERGIKAFVRDRNVDVLAMQQLNICWNKVQHKNKIWDRFRGYEEHFNLSVAWNKDDKNNSKNAFQPGGTALLSVGQISHVWQSMGADARNLGRWTWSRFQGSRGRFCRVVSVYRPSYNVKKYNSAYMQQYRYSLKERGEVCPRALFGWI